MNQFEVVTREKLHTHGKEAERDKYCRGTLFIDLASGYTRIFHQVTLTAPKTVQSKLQYECNACDAGFFIKSYHLDNGVFTAALFQAELEREEQKLMLSGVNAQFQNGHAKQAIGSMAMALRAMLLHAILRWTDVMTPDLYPLAMLHAKLLHNIVLPQSNGLSSKELFTQTNNNHSKLHLLPLWGCPTYV